MSRGAIDLPLLAQLALWLILERQGSRVTSHMSLEVLHPPGINYGLCRRRPRNRQAATDPAAERVVREAVVGRSLQRRVAAAARQGQLGVSHLLALRDDRPVIHVHL